MQTRKTGHRNEPDMVIVGYRKSELTAQIANVFSGGLRTSSSKKLPNVNLELIELMQILSGCVDSICMLHTILVNSFKCVTKTKHTPSAAKMCFYSLKHVEGERWLTPVELIDDEHERSGGWTWAGHRLG